MECSVSCLRNNRGHLMKEMRLPQKGSLNAVARPGIPPELAIIKKRQSQSTLPFNCTIRIDLASYFLLTPAIPSMPKTKEEHRGGFGDVLGGLEMYVERKIIATDRKISVIK